MIVRFSNNSIREKTENDLLEVKSITKSIMSVLIDIAMDKGYIRSLDQPLTYFLLNCRKTCIRQKRILVNRNKS